ncbi:MAG: hypothetical protein IJM37_00525 [Lachnospiraceae bacterium]|nr:hypothetical protein [Lachnospiraceae bacterium]
MREKNIKLLAAIMTMVMLIVGISNGGAYAATGNNYSRNYASRYITISPGTNSYTDVCELYATNATYKASCSSLTISGTTGTVTVSCSNYTMNQTVQFTQANKSKTYNIYLNSSNQNALFPCSCFGNGNVYATGNVKIN